jgi:hypothetical protein
MKTSNKILAVYGVLFAAFTFGSLGLNVQKYRASKPAMQECLEALREGVGKPVLVVEPGTRLMFHRSGDGSFGFFSRGGEIGRARVSGDTLYVNGAVSLFAPNSVQRIIRGGETIDVPPVSEWEGGEKFY